MKKFLKLLYLMMCYILGIPILIVMLTIATIIIVIKDIIDGYGFDLEFVKDMIGAFWEGIKMGHRQNMQFIKYGNDYTKWFSEELK